MDNGSTFPYRYWLVQRDGEGKSEPGIGSPGARVQGDERRRKRLELRPESELPWERSRICQASNKSSLHHKSIMPVPETDTGGVVENTEGREITLSKELGKMAP